MVWSKACHPIDDSKLLEEDFGSYLLECTGTAKGSLAEALNTSEVHGPVGQLSRMAADSQS